MAYKLNISKPGFNVLTETDPNNLIFSSDYNTLKYFISGTITLVYNSAPTTLTNYSTTVSLGLSYNPVILCYVDVDSSGVYQLMPKHFGAIASLQDFLCYWTNNTLTFRLTMYSVFGGGASKTATFKYFVFKNDTGL